MSIVNLKIIFVKKKKQTRKRLTQGRARQYTQSDLSLQRVAATCCCNLSPSVYQPLHSRPKAEIIIGQVPGCAVACYHP